MAGFAAKYYMFYIALSNGHPELLIIGALASILGIYYYLRPIATMFMLQEESVVMPSIPTSPVVPATPSRGSVNAEAKSVERVITGSLAATAAATAVAVKTPTAKLANTSDLSPEQVKIQFVASALPTQEHRWFTWFALAWRHLAHWYWVLFYLFGSLTCCKQLRCYCSASDTGERKYKCEAFPCFTLLMFKNLSFEKSLLCLSFFVY